MTSRDRFLAGHLFTFSKELGSLPNFKYTPPIHEVVTPELYMRIPETGQFIAYCWLMEICEESVKIHFKLFGIESIEQTVRFDDLNFINEANLNRRARKPMSLISFLEE